LPSISLQVDLVGQQLRDVLAQIEAGYLKHCIELTQAFASHYVRLSQPSLVRIV
jgi:hypothetical protein